MQALIEKLVDAARETEVQAVCTPSDLERQRLYALSDFLRGYARSLAPNRRVA